MIKAKYEANFARNFAVGETVYARRHGTDYDGPPIQTFMKYQKYKF